MSAKIAIFILAMMVCGFGLISAKSLENHNQSEEASHTFDDKDLEKFPLQWIVPIVKAINGLGDQTEGASHSYDDKDQEKIPLQWIVPIVKAIKGLGDQSEEAIH
uniref:uncharacterized protein LOC120342297 isoform X5 n=1 Tax=Styela clava TaxID=7725 RepID=UPI00193A429D|nr:uncharacterized protein LOC120342297 isoform X5 [Styela clava]